MIPNHTPREVITSGTGQSSNFAISVKDSVHLMTILRNTLYTDKILAVLREYSANAWDAHRMVNKGSVPIKVHLPTDMQQELSIRDFGPGLSREDIFTVYTQYGASTKRNSDSTVGMLGIGSKSGFAYSDSFTITSWHGGTKSIYVAVLDKTQGGRIDLLDESPCDPAETGIEIQIPVKPADFEVFKARAVKLFTYFSPRPDINIDLPNLVNKTVGLTKGVLYHIHQEETIYRRRPGEDTTPTSDVEIGKWVAVMGCIPYAINLNQLKLFAGQTSSIAEFLRNSSGALFFNIGEVQINASREELKYEDDTIDILTKRFEELVEEYVKSVLNDVGAGILSPFERRLRVQSLRTLAFAIPKELQKFIDADVKITGKFPNEIYPVGAFNRKEALSLLPIREKTRLVLQDEKRPMGGYQLFPQDILLRSNKKIDWKDARPKLDKLLADNNLNGIPVVMLSSIPWSDTVRVGASSRLRPSNPKHRVTHFVYTGSGYDSSSDSWEVVENRQPQPTDVFVILKRFQVWYGEPFHASFGAFYSEIKKISEMLNIPIPNLYGYKSTEKNPLKAADFPGTELKIWGNAWKKNIQETMIKDYPDLLGKVMRQIAWRDLKRSWDKVNLLDPYWKDGIEENGVTKLSANLGDSHAIVKLLKDYQEYWKDSHDSVLGKLRNDGEFFVTDKTTPITRSLRKLLADELEILIARYPLLAALENGFGRLVSKKRHAYLDYVTLVDNREKEKELANARTKILNDQRVDLSNLGGEVVHG